MSNYRIEFEKISWVEASAGLRYKEIDAGGEKLKLVEFSEGFVERDWCIKGHCGVVLEGSAKVLFNNGREVFFQKNDIISIPPGEKDKHKTIIADGETIRVLFFE
jgi:hypothetical protein